MTIGWPAGGEKEFVEIADALDEQHDHVSRSILHHVVQELAGAEITLIAGTDAIADGNADRLGAMLDGKTDAARLRNDPDPAFGRDQRHMPRLDIDGRAEGCSHLLHLAHKTFGIGTGNPHAGALGDLDDPVLHRGAIAALLGKARGDDHAILDADRGAFLQRADHGACRNDDDREID